MKNKLLASAAALALIAGVQAASAQGMQQQDRGQGGSPSMQQDRGSQGSDMKQDRRPGQQERQTQSPTPSQAEGGKSQAEKPGDRGTQGTADRKTTEKKEVTQGRSGDAKNQPGNDKSQAELSSDQRTQISKTLKTTNVKRVTNVNFNVSVGTVVPGSISFYPLPSNVVAVVPAYRGYLYFVVGDEIVIVHPRTRAIVAVIPA